MWEKRIAPELRLRGKLTVTSKEMYRLVGEINRLAPALTDFALAREPLCTDRKSVV